MYNKYKIKNLLEEKGQVMIVTLLVLTILTIIVVSVILIVTRDVEQQFATKEYELFLDQAETKILESMDTFASPSIKFEDISQSECSPGASTSSTQVLQCNFADTATNTQIRMEIRDEADINEYPLQKDQVFQMYLVGNLGSYDDNIEVLWTGDASMAFSIDYVDATGKYHAVKDVFDSAGLITNEQSSIVFGQPGNTNLQGVSFNIRNDIPALRDNPSFRPVGISFRPLMTQDGGETSLSVKTVGLGIPQIRVFEATGFSLNAETEFGETPAPTAIAKVPLYPSMPSIFDYVLLTRQVVKGSAGESAPVSSPSTFCGNGVVEIGEQCDDGNNSETDLCSNSCQFLCQPGWTSFGNHCYRFFSSQFTYSWDSGRNTCLSNNADLVSVHSAEENAFLITLTGNSYAWMGMNRPNSVSDPNWGVGWVWVDGTPFGYTNWLPAYPNNYNNQNERCGQLNWRYQELGAGFWNDVTCGNDTLKEPSAPLCKKVKGVL